MICTNPGSTRCSGLDQPSCNACSCAGCSWDSFADNCLGSLHAICGNCNENDCKTCPICSWG